MYPLEASKLTRCSIHNSKHMIPLSCFHCIRVVEMGKSDFGQKFSILLLSQSSGISDAACCMISLTLAEYRLSRHANILAQSSVYWFCRSIWDTPETLASIARDYQPMSLSFDECTRLGTTQLH